MILLIIYTIIFFIIITSIVYSVGIKKGLLLTFYIIIFSTIGVLAERLIDKQFDSITIIVCLIAVCMTVIFFWLRKKLSYSLDNEKKEKRKGKFRY